MAKAQSTVLVVDDNPLNLGLIVAYLDRAGFEVLAADNGEGVLNLLQYTQPDIILLDVMMPGMNGFETCRRIKNDPKVQDIPIIFMTALADVDNKVKGFEAGAVDYLTKPIQHGEMLVRVNTHLTLRHLQQQLQENNKVLEERVAHRTAELGEANRDLARANHQLSQINQDLLVEVEKRQATYQKLNKINAAYSRFVPKEFLKLLNQDDIVGVQLGDNVQMDMTIMFADIRSFTTLSEKMTPQENFNFVNAYLSRVSPIIRQYHGFVDKFIGDAIMALFPTQPEDALQSAISMLQAVTQYNQTRTRSDRPPIHIGMGLHTGTVMVGTVGEAERLEGTVISDAVNLASRLETLTKVYGADLLVSEHTLFGLERPNQYHFRFLDKVKVKGKEAAVSVFEILDNYAPEIMTLKLKTLTHFERGLLHYHSEEFSESKQYFEQVLTADPEDKAAQLYIQRVDYFLTHGVPLDWTGIESMK